MERAVAPPRRVEQVSSLNEHPPEPSAPQLLCLLTTSTRAERKAELRVAQITMARDRLAAMRGASPVHVPYSGPSAAGFVQSDYHPVAAAGDEGAFGSYGYDGYGYHQGAYEVYDNSYPDNKDAGDVKLESRISLGAPNESTIELTSFSQPSAPPRSFWDELSEVQELLSEFAGAITAVQNAQASTLSASGPDRAQAEVETAQQRARSLANRCKTRIQQVATQVAMSPSGIDGQTKATQVAVNKSKFKELIQRYTEVENGYRSKLHSRAERQFKIVKPDATEAEIADAIDGQDGQDGVFAQALMTSNRQGKAATALRAAQDRHAEIKKIEETMTELAQLFNDVDVLLTEQDEQINMITANGQNAYQYMEEGHQHTTKAVVSARKARKKRWICFVYAAPCATWSICTDRHSVF